MKKDRTPNRLINESSPYLQQHAYNPVDWYPWGEEAFAAAQKADKPILVSIGYSTCHWCHVMERESFENEGVAALMNELFINIKVDREERPDVDAIYMEAVMLVQEGQGGWPLNCFLLPNGQPFFGGTYFPPQPRHRRAAWPDVIQRLSNAYQDNRGQVVEQAKQIMNYIKQADNQFVNQIEIAVEKDFFDKKYLATAFENLQKNVDFDNGGWGSSPKFPSTMSLRFCLNYYLAEQDQTALKQLTFSLDKMVQGGIYDQLKGGFARYTVDAAWLVPHFEKMLYDNALLVGLLADTYKLTQKPLYQDKIIQTLDWVAAEMLSEEGLFYSALDADSEGIEGKFYVWKYAEIVAVLGENAKLFCQYYDCSPTGNWEGVNILNCPQSKANFIVAHALDSQDFEAYCSGCIRDLLAVRAKRIRPSLDDKILLDWNAMMITAYSKAYQALQIESYKEKAINALELILRKFRVTPNKLPLYHSYKEGQAKQAAFLDDYALLIAALLEVDKLVEDDKYRLLAKDYCTLVTHDFLDSRDNLFFFTSAKQQDIILHKKLLFDNATPSGNSTMIHNLQRLGVLFDSDNYRQMATKALLSLAKTMQQQPTAFGRWLNALFLEIYPLSTLTIGQEESQKLMPQIQQKLLFNTFVKIDSKNSKGILVCKDASCALPVDTLAEALKLL